MCRLNIQPEWQQRLAALGLDSWQALLEIDFDQHERGSRGCYSHCFDLDQHTTLCLKHEQKRSFGRILCELLCLKLPQRCSRRERLNIKMLAADGFSVPDVVAWGEKRILGLPRAGLLLLRPPSMLTLPAFLAAEFDSQARHDMVEKAENLLRLLQERGYHWPDCQAENFLVLPNLELGLCNLESLQRCKTPNPELCQRQFEKFYASLCGD